MQHVGDSRLRVIAGVPSAASTFRLDLVVASIARKRLWLTDAYFVATSAYVQALRAAAKDGVDVRLLVPGASDIPALQPLSRAQYRPLLESGVRVYEWDGTMLHAKTAVADGLWARVGSTNLNLASWMTNYELDVAIEDRTFAATMAKQFEHDLCRATEIVLTARNRVRRSETSEQTLTQTGAARPPVRRSMSGSANRAAAGAVSVGSALGAALTNRRSLGPAEAGLLFIMATIVVTSASCRRSGRACWRGGRVCLPVARRGLGLKGIALRRNVHRQHRSPASSRTRPPRAGSRDNVRLLYRRSSDIGACVPCVSLEHSREEVAMKLSRTTARSTDEIATALGDLIEEGRTLLAEVLDKPAQKTSNLKGTLDSVADMLAEYQSSATRAAQRGVKHGTRYAREADRYLHDNPWPIVAGGIVLGALAAFFLSQRR